MYAVQEKQKARRVQERDHRPRSNGPLKGAVLASRCGNAKMEENDGHVEMNATGVVKNWRYEKRNRVLRKTGKREARIPV
jgi:hypothetical protein